MMTEKEWKLTSTNAAGYCSYTAATASGPPLRSTTFAPICM
jgi:hypothetical protein